jgi:DHA1 family multidrug resistance protein-like MFS transporter
VIAAVFLVGTGIGSVLPIMPLFLRERGSSYAIVGVVVSASLVAQVLGQYPAGRLSDRIGRGPLMIGGLVVTGAAIAAFALPVSIGWLIALRFLQGLGSAAFRPGSRAVVADLVPEGERGIAYGWLTGADMAGLIFGPAFGGLLAVFGRSLVFELTGLAMFLAAALLAFTLDPRRLSLPLAFTTERSEGEIRIPGASAAVRGVVMLTISIGFLYGVYNVVWSLFMKAIGASDWVVGLSFSLFALPLVLTAPVAGWASDRLDRRWLAVGSTGMTAVLAPVYPILQNIPAVIGVGAIEASAAAFGEPAMNTFLMSSVAPSERGRAVGTVGTADAASKAIGALIAGALFAAGIAVPFLVSSAVGIGFILLAVPSLRSAGRDFRSTAQAMAVARNG